MRDDSRIGIDIIKGAIDELMNPPLGLTPGPQAFPWQAHARGFSGHLAFGLTSELVLEGLDRVA
jgi:hypothetical protein